METQIFYETFKGYPVIAIWQVEHGIKKGKAPIVSFGLKKARAVIENIQAIEQWVLDNENQQMTNTPTTTTTNTTTSTHDSNSVRIVLTGLTPEQLSTFKSLSK